LPDSQAGYYCGFVLGILPGTDEEQGNAPDHREPAEDWRNGNVFVLFRSSVDRTDIKNLFLMRIVESLIGEGQRAQYDEKKSSPSCRFHNFCVHGKTIGQAPLDIGENAYGMLDPTEKHQYNNHK
jgi:hypothetical protein